MPLFQRKAAPVLALSPPEPLPAAVPLQPSAAPKASDLEKEIRSVIWQHISPELARTANLSLPELIDWISGVSRLSTPQIEALARKIGLIDTPETGIDRIRAKLVAMVRRRPTFAWLDWPGGGRGEDNLRDFAAGANGVLTLNELNSLAREFWGKYAELDQQTLMLKSTAPAPEPLGRGPDPHESTAETYPPPVLPGATMHLYPRDEGAERKPARLQHVGWS